jgi:hypothetical protein
MDLNHRMSESKSDALDQLGEGGKFGSFTLIRTEDLCVINTLL